MSEHDHTRDCILPSDGKAEGLVRASELFALAAERDALRAENERLKEWNREIALNAREFAAENEKLRAALESIADLPPGYADMRQDDLVMILASKARAALEEKP